MKELVVTVASISSMDECMMLARAFNSAKGPGSALRKRTLLVNSKNQKYVCKAYPAVRFWVVTKWDIVDSEKRPQLKVSRFIS